MQISVTHYTEGTGVRRYLPSEEYMTIEVALADMFERLRQGAQATFSGYNNGLATYVGAESPDDEATGIDTVIYGGCGPLLKRFLELAPTWREREDIEPGTPEQDAFIRHLFLKVTGHDLSESETEVALAMDQEDFLAAMAMSIETGECVTELFR